MLTFKDKGQTLFHPRLPFMHTYMVLFSSIVDSLYLVFDKCNLVLQLLHLPVHLVDKAIALLAACIEESEIVLVCLHLALELFVLSHQACTFVVESVAALFGGGLDLVLEIVETLACNAHMELVVELVENGMILVIHFVLILERHMTNGALLFDELLEGLLHVVNLLVEQGLET